MENEIKKPKTKSDSRDDSRVNRKATSWRHAPHAKRRRDGPRKWKHIANRQPAVWSSRWCEALPQTEGPTESPATRARSRRCTEPINL